MTDAREITVEGIVPCMDAWCKFSPCKCRDDLNALIAEGDKLTAQLACVSYNFEDRGNQLRNLDDKIARLEAERVRAGGEREQMLIGLLERWLRHADSGHWRDGTHLSLKATTTADDTRAILEHLLASSPSVSVERERETQRLDICASCGQPFRSCKCFNAPDTPQSVPTCTCSKHPLWDGYDGDCPIHGWFEPVAPDTPQSVPAEEITIEGERYRWNKSEKLWVICTPDAPLSQGDADAEEDARLHPWAPDTTEKEWLRAKLASLIAERDTAQLIAKFRLTDLEAFKAYAHRLETERDKLKEACDGYLAHAANLRGENAKLEERVSVLEERGKAVLQMVDNVDDWTLEAQSEIIEPFRAALRTSEEA
jgi:predicted nuclease with TOPRIM domain